MAKKELQYYVNLDLKKKILDLLFPPRPYCAACGKKLLPGERNVCAACENKIVPISPPFCQKCGRPFGVSSSNKNSHEKHPSEYLCHDCQVKNHLFVEARSFGQYEGVLKKLIYEFKYRGNRELTELLGQKMLQTLEYHLQLSWPHFDYIVPVPLHKKREHERGFNQAYLLADALRRHTGIPIFIGIKRIKPTEHQTFLDRSFREKNLSGAFKLLDKNNIRIKNANLLLVDDVYTTGSTVDECARVLLDAGAKSVYVLTCARG